MKLVWEAAGGTDVGRLREGNEDAFFLDADRGVFVVADGMGGHVAGEVASELAVRSTAEALIRAADAGVPPAEASDILSAAFRSAWDGIVRMGESDPNTAGMGTTLTACLLSPEGWCRIGHIGDSRLYRVRDGHAELLTQDHTWVHREVQAGRLDPARAESHPFSHILTRVLAADLSPEPDLVSTSVLPSDVLLLCTDGLHGLVPPAAVHETVTGDLPVEQIVARLIDLANVRGGRDNITAIVIRARTEAT